MITSDYNSSLSVRDVARRIVRPGEDLEVVVNRLRNWTKEGLLEFLGNKHPGTGRTRIYSPSAIIDAALLTAFTDSGIAAVTTTQFKGQEGTFLQYGRLGAAKVFAPENRDVLHFLVLAIAPFGSGDPPTIILLRGEEHSEPADRYGIEGRIIRDRGHVLTPHRSPCSIVLNLTEIFAPLRHAISAVIDKTGSVAVDLLDTLEATDGEH